MCIEERNGSIARKHIGYTRLDEHTLVPLVSEIFHYVCLIHNHFRATRRMISKTREGAKWKRTFEKKAKTPYQRVLENDSVSKVRKAKLRAEHEKLDVLSLHKKLATLKAEFIKKLKK